MSTFTAVPIIKGTVTETPKSANQFLTSLNSVKETSTTKTSSSKNTTEMFTTLSKLSTIASNQHLPKISENLSKLSISKRLLSINDLGSTSPIIEENGQRSASELSTQELKALIRVRRASKNRAKNCPDCTCDIHSESNEVQVSGNLTTACFLNFIFILYNV